VDNNQEGIENAQKTDMPPSTKPRKSVSETPRKRQQNHELNTPKKVRRVRQQNHE
jgi:hypothetical protein